jgi:hypothetical protein
VEATVDPPFAASALVVLADTTADIFSGQEQEEGTAQPIEPMLRNSVPLGLLLDR